MDSIYIKETKIKPTTIVSLVNVHFTIRSTIYVIVYVATVIKI